MNLFWAFGLVLLLLLLFVIVVRNKILTWGWNFAAIAMVVYAVLFKMTGTPRDAWLFSTIENVHGDVEIVYATVLNKKWIYLLVKSAPDEPPYYLRLEYTKDLEDDLDKAKMKAARDKTVLLADAEQLSRWRMHIEKQKSNGHGKSGGKLNGKDSGSITTEAKGDESDRGGERLFYPKPVDPDPMKNYQTTIDDIPTTPPAGASIESGN